MEAERGNTEGITGVSPLAIGQTFFSGTVDIAILETTPVPMYSPNKIDDDILYLGMSKSHHKKVYTPGTKPDTIGDVPYAKGGAVSDAKSAAEKYCSHTGRKRQE